MVFSIEAVQANEGDCLILEYGKSSDRRFILIDGGTPGVYKKWLKPRLEALRDQYAPGGKLPLELVMCSHIDNDHIGGLLNLFKEMDATPDRCPVETSVLWHNSFDDIIGNNDPSLLKVDEPQIASLATALEAKTKDAMLAAIAKLRPEAKDDPERLEELSDLAAVLANVPQGRTLRDLANKLGLAVNDPFGAFISADTAGGTTVDLEDDLTFLVLAPLRKRVIEYQEAWDKDKSTISLAAYEDKSPFNLASTVVLAEFGKGNKRKSMLLTGDARGDDIIEACRNAQILTRGKLHVDLLKVPHHGSHHNVETDFFRTITADHYLISGDGRFGNPETEMLEMLAEARGVKGYTVHLTNRDGKENLGKKLAAFFKKRKMTVRYREDDELSVRVDLL